MEDVIDAAGSVLAVLVVVVALPLAWLVALRLLLLSRSRPGLRVLRERAIAAFALALIVTVFAVVFVNNELDVPLLDAGQTRVLTRGVLFLLSVIPSLYWLFLYRND